MLEWKETKKPVPKAPHPNPSQAEGDRETIDEALDHERPPQFSVNDPEDHGKVSPEEATRIQSYDLPDAA